MEVRIIYSPFHLNRLINTCLQLSLIYWSWVILVITSECGLPIGYVFPQRCKLLKINSSIVVTIKHSCIHERYIIDNQSSHLTLVKQTHYLLILSIIDVQHDASKTDNTKTVLMSLKMQKIFCLLFSGL